MAENRVTNMVWLPFMADEIEAYQPTKQAKGDFGMLKGEILRPNFCSLHHYLKVIQLFQ